MSGLLLLAVAYGFAYLHYRRNHTFIHRAGGYSHPGLLGIGDTTNHYIELGELIDGPMLGFAYLATEGKKELDPNSPQYKAIEEWEKGLVESQTRRERLFILFKPAAFCETVYWKIVDPDPVIPIP